MICELCGVEDAHNFHHLIPRTNHYNTRAKPLGHPQVAGYVKWKRAR